MQLVLCFGDKDAVSDSNVYPMLSRTFPNAIIVVGSAAGAIAHTQVEAEGYTVTAIEFESSTVLASSINIRDFSNSHEAGMALMKKVEDKEAKFIFILSDGQEVNGSELVRGINDANTQKIPVSGGLAADGYHFKSTITGVNQTPEPGNIIAISFAGSNLMVNHGTDAGWENFGPERMITKSKHNRLFEIDGKNALDLYKRYLGKEAESLPGAALHFPLAVSQPNRKEFVVRTILSIDNEDKSMLFAGDLPEGSRVRFMRANLDKLTSAATQAAIKTFANQIVLPQLAILVSCVGRRLVLNERTDEELSAVDEIFEGKTLLSGFYSYGEIAPCPGNDCSQLHNQTMSITTLYEIEQIIEQTGS